MCIEGELEFRFPDGWLYEAFDKTPFYKDHFQKLANSKCVDIIAFAPEGEDLWLIEVKDYRRYSRRKDMDLFREVAIKVRDTLANLYLAQRRPEIGIYEFAKKAGKKRKIRIALHLEQPKLHSRLYPEVVNRGEAVDELRKAVRTVDPHPWFCEMAAMPSNCPWQVIPREN